MLTDYIRAAMRHAKYELLLEDGSLALIAPYGKSFDL